LNYEDKKIIILAHVVSTVPAQDLKEYFLKNQVEELLFVAHPLFYIKDRPGPYFELYKKGKLIKKVQFKNRKYPSIIQYVKDYLLTLVWVIKVGNRWDLIIALDNLNTLSALTLKMFKVADKVIYYTIDFVPNRFDNKLLNIIYGNIEKIAVRYADMTWNLTSRIAIGREKIRGMDRKKYNRQIIVPIGIWFDRIKRKKFNEMEKHTIVYAGGLSPHQGIQLVIDAMPQVLKKINDAKMLIIGIGNYENALKEQVKKLKLEKNIEFLGYMEKHEDVEKILSNCGLAVAMYSKELSKWSYFADPSKIKSYLAAGLPVITTSLTMISKDLLKKECGIISDYNKNDLAWKIIKFLKDEKKQKKYRENAIKFGSQFDWNKILDENISKIFRE